MYTKSGNANKALEEWEWVKNGQVVPDLGLYIQFLIACAKAKSSIYANQIIEHLV